VHAEPPYLYDLGLDTRSVPSVSEGDFRSPGIVSTAENVAEGLGSPSSSVRPVLDVTDNGGREDEYPYCREQSLRAAPRSQSTTKGMWL